MPYIGKQLVRGQNRELDDISGSFNGSNTVFNLTVGGDSITPGSALQLFISVGGVLQNPNTDFTVAGNQITFTTAPGSGLSFFGILQGDAVDFNTPADGSVTTAKLGSNLTINVADGTAGTPSIQFNGSGTDTGFYSPTTDEIGASVAGGEALRIDTSGRLLVGTSSTSATNTLVLQGSNGGTYSQSILTLANADSSIADGNILGSIRFSDSSHDPAVVIESRRDGGTWTSGSSHPTRLVFSTTADGDSSPTERMRINSTGVLIKYGDTNTARIIPQTDNAGYIGQSTHRWQAIYAVNGTIQTSDKREKTEIIDSPLGTDFIKSLRPVAYKWKVGGYEHSVDEEGEDVFTPVAGQRTHYGFIAQEVRQAAGDTDFGGWLLEDLSDPDSKQSLRLHEFISPMVKALQEAVAKIETLEAKVAALESA